MDNNEVYLGDGVYASSSGYDIKLRTPRQTGDHEIYLDSYTLSEFLKYVETLKAKAKGP